ncbi:50S ribosomal protein L22 [Candidatus Daviesbacteria bacterium]|nr:50S ribosomal protein L22 [Candidatus Daviesbacteria bacterium]
MEFITIQKNITSSPRKLRLVAGMVRKMDPYAALDVLQFTTNGAARPLAKAIKTVVANAGSKEGLVFKSIEINEGLKMRRYRVGTAGRGRGRPYKKRTAHIKIVLTDEISDKGKVKREKLKKKESKTKEKIKKGEEKV